MKTIHLWLGLATLGLSVTSVHAQTLTDTSASAQSEASAYANASRRTGTTLSSNGTVGQTLVSSVKVVVEHVTIQSTKSFEEVKTALESAVPPLNDSFIKLLMKGKVNAARDVLERQAPLSIFSARDHGGLLAIAGRPRKAIQYEIGNPLTASIMSRQVISTALYAPVRILLREDDQGVVGFEYDRPITTFGQFRTPAVESVAEDLDKKIRIALMRAAD